MTETEYQEQKTREEQVANARLVELYGVSRLKTLDEVKERIIAICEHQNRRWPPVAVRMNDLNRRLSRILNKLGTPLSQVATQLVMEGRLYLIVDDREYSGSGSTYLFSKTAIDEFTAPALRGETPLVTARKNVMRGMIQQERGIL